MVHVSDSTRITSHNTLTEHQCRPTHKRPSKNDGKVMSGRWNIAVDEYIALGTDRSQGGR